MPLVLLWFLFEDLRIFGLVYVSTVYIGVVSSMTGSYFLIFQNWLSEAKPRIKSSGAVPFHSLRWLCVLISVLHQGKGLGSYATSSEFPICSTRCCFTITFNWLFQSFALIDWARCPIAPGGLFVLKYVWMLYDCYFRLSVANRALARCLIALDGFFVMIVT